MSDKVEAVAAPAVVTPNPKKAAVTKTPKTPKTKKPRVATKATHPPASEMVLAAVKALKEKKGSSLKAIKKYIVATYKVDGEKQAIFIRKYLRTAVAKGALVQTKGSGAAGSFKLPVGKTEAKSKSTKAAVKPRSASKAKKPASSKKVVPKAKKAVAEKKKMTAKVAAKPPKAKTTKPKVAKASPKPAKAASKKKASAPSSRTTAKKVAKK